MHSARVLRWVRGKVEVVTAPYVSRLARAAFAKRFRDLDQMRELAERAELLSRSLPNTRIGRDARARALAVLGNALRIRADYPGAYHALELASELWQRGSRCARLGSSIAEFRASYFESVREFSRAHSELSTAELLRRAQRRDLGKIWVQRALVFTHQGDAIAALELYDRAIIESRNRDVLRSAILSATWCWTEIEEPDMAEFMLAKGQTLLAAGAPGLRRRSPWLQARIADLRRSDAAAEALYVESLRQFLRLAMPHESALVSIDLAALHLRNDRPEPALGLAVQAGRLLVNVPGSAEALASRILMHASGDRLAAALTTSAANLFPLRSSARKPPSPR